MRSLAGAVLKTSRSTVLSLVLAATALCGEPSRSAAAEGMVGNGGDHIRGYFITIGQEILEFLRTSSIGVHVATQHGLDAGRLLTTLRAERLAVVDERLVDNTGTAVDAIGVPGSIRLYRAGWQRLIEQNEDVYYLVFHEMLRSASYNDDNYAISSSLRPFPAVNSARNFLPRDLATKKTLFKALVTPEAFQNDSIFRLSEETVAVADDRFLANALLVNETTKLFRSSSGATQLSSMSLKRYPETATAESIIDDLFAGTAPNFCHEVRAFTAVLNDLAARAAACRESIATLLDGIAAANNPVVIWAKGKSLGANGSNDGPHREAVLYIRSREAPEYFLRFHFGIEHDI